MPQVPYRPDYQGTPVSETPQIRLNLPGAAFGVNIGEALQRRGGALTEFGNDVFGAAIKLQSQTNEFEARKKVADYEEQVAYKQAQFDALPPEQQMGALQGHIAGLKQLRESTMSQLGAPEARLMFDRESQPFLGRNIFQSAARAGDSQKRYMFQEGNASLERNVNNWGSASDEELESKKAQIGAGVDAIAEHGDWGPEQSALRKQELISKAAMNAALMRADQGHPESALQMLENQHKSGDILEPHYRAAMDHVNGVIATGKASVDAADAYSKGLSGTAAHDLFVSNAEKLPDNDVLRQNYINNADAKFYRQSLATKHIDDLREQQHKQAWMEMLAQPDPNNPLGYKINSVADFKNDPQGKALINSMDAKEKTSIELAIAGRIRSRDYATNQQTFQTLEGMAHENPQEFLKVNPFDPKLPLNWNDRSKLLKDRKDILRDPMQNRDTQAASSWMLNSKYGGALDSIGLARTPGAQATSAEKDEFYRYKGILREGIQAWREDHEGRPPTRDEFMEKIAPNVLKETSGWFSKYYSLEGPAAIPITDKALEESRQELAREAIKRKMPAPTDADAREHAVLKQWHTILDVQGGKSGGTGPAPGPAPTGPQPSATVPRSQ